VRSRRSSLPKSSALVALLLVLATLLGACSQSAAVENSPSAAAKNSPSAAVENNSGSAVEVADYKLDTSIGSPYLSTVVAPLSDKTWGEVDSNGVLQVKIRGEKVYHPVNSAWFISQMISSYRGSKDPEYLRRAEATTRYLILHSVRDESGATWFPYTFKHAPGKGKLDMGRPWYSGMAQGMMLSTFVNLYETTGDIYWKNHADRVFLSFKVEKQNGQPWFREVEKNGDKNYAWFEEYVGKDVPSSHVVNGHIYAVYGAYDYYRLTKSEDALLMFNEGAATIRDHFEDYRRPGGPSWYAVAPFAKDVWKYPASYHKGVANQLTMLGRMSGDETFTQQAELLRSDHS
jgi:hypothetical protein